MTTEEQTVVCYLCHEPITASDKVIFVVPIIDRELKPKQPAHKKCGDEACGYP